MSKDNRCIGSTYEELKYIMDVSGCGFCLDIGHAICSANSQNIEPYGFVEKLSTLNPKRVHLSDIDTLSIYDQHLNYGNGNLDFRKVLKILSNSISITIETNKKSSVNLIDYKYDAIFLKQIINTKV